MKLKMCLKIYILKIIKLSNVCVVQYCIFIIKRILNRSIFIESFIRRYKNGGRRVLHIYYTIYTI